MEVKSDDKIYQPEYKITINNEIINKMIKVQSATTLRDLRIPTYNLVTCCIPTKIILKEILIQNCSSISKCLYLCF